MAANVAIQSDADAESEPGRTVISANRPKPRLGRGGVHLNHSPIRPGDAGSNIELSSHSNSSLGFLMDSDRPDSSMDRLNAALSDDALQAQTLPQHSLTPLEARIRVDLIISRARQLLDIGQLDEAYRNAVLAQELAETTQLDFSAEEDRPIDLVRRIESQLEDQQLTDHTHPDGSMPVSVDPEIGRDQTTEMAKPSSPPLADGADKSRLARMRRDWSTLFKRERKPVVAETEPGRPENKVNRNGSGSRRSIEDRAAPPIVNHIARDGVVMANRSVALGTSDSPETLNLAHTIETTDHDIILESESNRSSRIEYSTRFDADRTDDRDNHDSSSAMVPEISRIRQEMDDGSISQPDLEVREPLRRSREVESAPDDTPKVAFEDDDDDDRKTNWNAAYVAFGICSLLAMACYRRGAT